MAASIFAALVAGKPEALALLPCRFAEPEAWRAAAESAGGRTAATGVVRALREQSEGLAPSAARTMNLDRLAAPGTTVVVTGQQAGLLGGPLYTLHKAATAVVRARQVEAWTGRPTVPLFWVQSEDHDYAEIAHVALPTSAGRLDVALPEDATPSRVSIAHRALPAETAQVLDEVEAAASPLPHGAEVVALLRRHYVAGRPIARAFAGLLAELFADDGLLVLDPRVPEIARLAAPVLERALDAQEALGADLAARAEALRAAGFDAQVPTRKEAALVFFHHGGSGGPRHRLVRRGGDWETPAGRVTDAELGELLAREPMRFSTTALLRPLVQDTLLPTCAYVGGPAEVSYFAQLPPVYARLGVPMPLVAPRARLRVLHAATRRLLGKLGLTAAEATVPRADLLARLATRAKNVPDPAALRERLVAPLERELGALQALGLPALERPLRRTRRSTVQALEKLARRVERAALEQDTVTTDRVDRLRDALYPGDVPQERAYGFVMLAAQVGLRPLLQAILGGAESLEPAVQDVSV